MTHANPNSSIFHHPDVHAWRSRRAWVWFILVVILALTIDLASKSAAFNTLLDTPDLEARTASIKRALSEAGKDDSSKQVLHQLQLYRQGPMGIRITLSTNPGVVFGLRLPPAAVVGMTVATIAMIGGFFAFSHRRARWSHVAFGLILAGAIGNLYDRLFSVVALPGIAPIEHQVRDFLDFSAWGYPWIFNLADVWLVVGVAMIMLAQLTGKPKAAA